ncbi:hypothetical protein RKD18_000124 [Streptomyces phaeoluteigriseus]
MDRLRPGSAGRVQAHRHPPGRGPAHRDHRLHHRQARPRCRPGRSQYRVRNPTTGGQHLPPRRHGRLPRQALRPATDHDLRPGHGRPRGRVGGVHPLPRQRAVRPRGNRVRPALQAADAATGLLGRRRAAARHRPGPGHGRAGRRLPPTPAGDRRPAHRDQRDGHQPAPGRRPARPARTAHGRPGLRHGRQGHLRRARPLAPDGPQRGKVRAHRPQGHVRRALLLLRHHRLGQELAGRDHS